MDQLSTVSPILLIADEDFDVMTFDVLFRWICPRYFADFRSLDQPRHWPKDALRQRYAHVVDGFSRQIIIAVVRYSMQCGKRGGENPPLS